MKKRIIFFSLGLLLCSCKKTPTIPTAPSVQLPTINHFSANPDEIDFGESSTLSWSVSNATTIYINQGIGNVSANGSIEIAPQDTVKYSITASNADGTKHGSCTLTVNAVAILVLDGDLTRSMTSFGCPKFEGYVKNIGNLTGHNDAAKTTIIDTAKGYPMHMFDIPPDTRAYFDAVAYYGSSHDNIPAYDVEITWINGPVFNFFLK